VLSLGCLPIVTSPAYSVKPFQAAPHTSISDLAASFEMTLTGMKKHVQILERSGLVTTEKIGRVRTCRPGPRRLLDETAWIARYRQMLDARLNRLGEFLERTKGKP
jgi:predicted ArsR family transcriptional regulator